jgi:putative lipoic acid-binding regulatory protein
MGIQEHLWDFPCVHSVKIVGLSEYPLKDVVAEVVAHHAPDFDRSTIRSRKSGAGKYTSVTVDVHFINKEQVEALYHELHERPEIHLTL